MKIDQAIDMYLAYLKRRHKAAGTIKDYGLTLRKFASSYDHVGDDTVDPFLDQYSHIPTRNKVLAHIQAFARWAALQAPHLLTTFTTSAIKTELNLPIIVPDKERDAFLNALVKINHVAYYHAEILVYTGLRFNEAYSLETTNYYQDDQGNAFVRFFGKNGRERLVPLTERACVAFVMWTSQPIKPSERTIRRAWKQAMQKAGIAAIKPHWFRHTVGTKLANAGEPYDRIADFLGNSVEVTRSRYARVNTTKLAQMGALI